MSEEEYARLIASVQPKSPIRKDCLNAFWIGGTICLIGQLLQELWGAWGLPKAHAAGLSSMTLVAISALLTGLSVYDDIAKHAGAGTLVPITGFANAVCAPAVEFRTEGFVTGVGVRMFTIAGPVIVYGTAASVVYGFLYWLMTI